MEKRPMLKLYKNLLPIGSPNRPGTKLDLSRGNLLIVVHETGNPHSTANEEIDFLRSPFQQGRMASFHLAVDQFGVAQGLPLDEVGYHAGDGCDDISTDNGCFRSIAIETIVNTAQNWDIIRWNLADVIVGICLDDPKFDWGSGRTKGLFDIDHLAQHNWVSNDSKNCPQHIREEGFWPVLMERVDAYYEALKPDPKPGPKPRDYAPKRKPPMWDGKDHLAYGVTWHAIQRVVTAIRTTPRLRYFSPSAPRVGPTLKRGEDFVIDWWVENLGGGKYVVTPSGTVVKASDVKPDIFLGEAYHG